ncbi:MAG TPA: FtsW/RodA/SpoVE family cell cycle protein, partial [Acidobacteriota bacterium]|nr:FtsW/RodA/SpoVE family cell cycle protein [Acidobacteriota bacterium]
MARKLSSDKLLFTITIALMMFGLVMIYSASAVLAMEKYGNPFYFVERQAVWCVISLVAMVVVMQVPYRKWNNRYLIFGSLITCVLLLIAVLFMPAVANVHRWFRIGPLSMQSAELAKLPLILFLAYFLSRRQGQINSLLTILPCLFVCGQLALLVVIEPDLGTAVMIVSITIGLLFLAGMPWRWFAAFGGIALPAFYFLVMNVAYRR